MRKFASAFLLSISLSTAACAIDTPPDQGYGPNPVLPPVDKSAFPRVHTADAIGWPQGGKPNVAEGLQVNAFTNGLKHPRWLYVLPNGDVLVAETDTPKPHDDKFSITNTVEGIIMKGAGSSKGSADRITLLRDTKGTGIAVKPPIFVQI